MLSSDTECSCDAGLRGWPADVHHLGWMSFLSLARMIRPAPRRKQAGGLVSRAAPGTRRCPRASCCWARLRPGCSPAAAPPPRSRLPRMPGRPAIAALRCTGACMCVANMRMRVCVWPGARSGNLSGRSAGLFRHAGDMLASCLDTLTGLCPCGQSSGDRHHRPGAPYHNKCGLLPRTPLEAPRPPNDRAWRALAMRACVCARAAPAPRRARAVAAGVPRCNVRASPCPRLWACLLCAAGQLRCLLPCAGAECVCGRRRCRTPVPLRVVRVCALGIRTPRARLASSAAAMCARAVLRVLAAVLVKCWWLVRGPCALPPRASDGGGRRGHARGPGVDGRPACPPHAPGGLSL